MEKTNSQQAKQDRDTIHIEDLDKFDILQKTVENHCAEQKITDKIVADKIEKLMPLTDLIPILQKIAQRDAEQAAAGKWAIKIGKVIGFIAVVVSSLGVIFWAAYNMIEAIIKTKQ